MHPSTRCSTPPPARYFGMTAYIAARVLFNASERGVGDSTPVVHMPVAEVKNPLNYLVVNTTKAPGGTEARRTNPGSFFESLALVVFSPSRAVYDAIRDAYIEAGLSPHAANYYPISGQTVRLVALGGCMSLHLVWSMAPWPVTLGAEPTWHLHLHTEQVRLHERGQAYDYDYPDLVTHLCRVRCGAGMRPNPPRRHTID